MSTTKASSALDSAVDSAVAKTLFDELRGAVIDLPVGTILPGWVSKEAVILMIDRVEAERQQADSQLRTLLMIAVDEVRCRLADRGQPQNPEWARLVKQNIDVALAEPHE